MSSNKITMSLPPLPPSIKAIFPFVQRADELRIADPIMAYWCTYYAAQMGLGLRSQEQGVNKYLSALITLLEEMKHELGANDAIDDQTAAAAYAENFALKVFSAADSEDRKGNATRATAKKFLAATHFLELLRIFEKVDDAAQTHVEKIRYAKWKASDIAKAIREGRRPTPGSVKDSLTQEQLQVSNFTDKCFVDASNISSEVESGAGLIHSVPLSTELSDTNIMNDANKAYPNPSLQDVNRMDDEGRFTQPTTSKPPVIGTPRPVPATAALLDPTSAMALSPRSSTLVDDKGPVGIDITTDPASTSPGHEPSNSYPSLIDTSFPSFAQAPPTATPQIPAFTHTHPASQEYPTAPPPITLNQQKCRSSDDRIPSDVSTLPPRLSAPSTITVELTPSVIAVAQKHCRFAISALEYEDAEQARKELRAALALLEYR